MSSEEESEYEDYSEGSDESSSEMEYVAVGESDGDDFEEKEHEISYKLEKKMLKEKLASFKENASPLENLVFTARKTHDIKNVQDDLQRELSLFALYLA